MFQFLAWKTSRSQLLSPVWYLEFWLVTSWNGNWQISHSTTRGKWTWKKNINANFSPSIMRPPPGARQPSGGNNDAARPMTIFELLDYIVNEVTTPDGFDLSIVWRSMHWGAGIAQRWDHSPPTIVAQVWFSDPASYVGWVCWFSTLHREVFLQVLRCPLSSKTSTWLDLC